MAGIRTHGSLFSGIGGFDLASSWMGWRNVFQCEIDESCRRVLEKNFPDVDRHADIKSFDASRYEGLVDVVSGGFPCQPFSTAGARRGKKDERYLWGEMFRVIRQVRPKFVVGENVHGIISMAHEDICLALESEGYAVGAFVVPAMAQDAPHQRKRVWFVAYSKHDGWPEGWERVTEGALEEAARRKEGERDKQAIPFINSLEFCEWHRWKDAIAQLRGVDDGVSTKLDKNRLKQLGNAVVPQVAYEVFSCISQIALLTSK